MPRIGFLLNHDAVHQVMHSIPAAFELARRYPDVEVVVISTTEAEAGAVAEIAAGFPGSRVKCQLAAPPAIATRFDKLTGNALLTKRFGVLWHHRELFRSFDALAVPDKTSLVLKRWLGADCPLMIHTFHGSGDRAGGFQGVGGFDFLLVPGRKYEQRLLADGRLRPGHYAVIGSMKIDHYRHAPRPRLFDNERPTVLYTPHFDPKLSSWYKWGAPILDYFRHNKDFNLVFAPHVLLYRRRWHISTEGGLPRLTPPVPETARQAENILVDTGSTACVDMTYTRGADIYLGDVSSQVYEFLYRPRPCIFLNRSQARWQNSDDFRFWHTGQVVDSLAALPAALACAEAEQARFVEEQKLAFDEAFALSDTDAAVRAADAIVGFLAKEKGQ
ncbi:MAG: hypothetical protein RQ899_12475 [Pseudomonadales bacterium]|nr:hypothetical protein [Pseudomonadales bacterium]